MTIKCSMRIRSEQTMNTLLNKHIFIINNTYFIKLIIYIKLEINIF